MSLPSSSPGAATDPLVIQFVHAAATPHNNYLLDAVASVPGVELHRHYLFGPRAVPGRPWKAMASGEVQANRVRNDLGTWFDLTLLRLALFDRRSVFFVIGWDYPILIWLLLVLGLRKRPLIMWDDGPSPESLAAFGHRWRPRQLMKRLLIALINRTEGAYFCTGAAALDDIRQMGVHFAKLVSLPFFVRPAAVDPAIREAHACDPGMVLIMAGGRLVREKGFDLYVEALGLLARREPLGWKAVLIGSGEEGPALHSQAVAQGLNSWLDFVAWAEPEQFAAYVHTCDIFVAPARFDHFPTPVIAALQAGTAVVASDRVGSANEFIVSGANGVVVRAGDAEALAGALGDLIRDPAARKRMARAGQDIIRAWPVERGAAMIVAAAREAQRSCAG